MNRMKTGHKVVQKSNPKKTEWYDANGLVVERLSCQPLILELSPH